MEQLIQFLHSIYPLSKELQDHLHATLKTGEYSKDSFLLRKGRICENICFIQKGLFRCFYSNEDAEDCSWFMREGDVIISVNSFFDQLPSDESIQALEDSVVFYISFSELESIYDQYMEFNVVGRKMLQHYYKQSEQRAKMRFQTAKQRFEYLLQHHPEIINRIPDKYLAGYLGLNPSTFCRSKWKYYREPDTPT